MCDGDIRASMTTGRWRVGAASRTFGMSPKTKYLLNDASRNTMPLHVDKISTGHTPENWEFEGQPERPALALAAPDRGASTGSRECAETAEDSFEFFSLSRDLDDSLKITAPSMSRKRSKRRPR